MCLLSSLDSRSCSCLERQVLVSAWWETFLDSSKKEKKLQAVQFALSLHLCSAVTFSCTLSFSFILGFTLCLTLSFGDTNHLRWCRGLSPQTRPSTTSIIFPARFFLTNNHAVDSNRASESFLKADFCSAVQLLSLTMHRPLTGERCGEKPSAVRVDVATLPIVFV